jgi:putative PEP-CTERM system TPR-repeat lipoprotein
MKSRALCAAAIPLVMCAGAACRRTSSATELVSRGDTFAGANQYAEAIVEYRSAIQRDPKLAAAHAHLADAYLKSKDSANAPRAVREYILAADLQPDNPDAQLKAGEFLLLAHKYEDARARADKVLLIDPKNATAQILRGYATAGLRDIDGALEEINAAVEADPDNVHTYMALGALELNSGKVADAEAAFKHAIEAQPAFAPGYLGLGTLYLSSGRLAEAETPLSRAVELAPNDVVAERTLATFYLASQRIADAEAPLRKIAEQTGDVTSRLRLANYYLLAKRGDAAVAVLSALASEKDGFAPATLRLAAIDRSQHRNADADRRVDAVLARDPNNAAALGLKGRFLLADGRIDDALARARAATAADRRAVDAWTLVGLIERRKGNIDRAIDAFGEVAKLNPRSAPVAVQLAELNLLKGAAATAMEFAETAYRAAPDNAAAGLVLVRASASNGDRSRAEHVLHDLLSAHADIADVHVQAALFAFEQKDRATARKEFTRALELAPSSLEALRGVLVLDMADHNVAHARALVDTRLARAPRDPNVIMLAADFAGATGDATRQESLLRSAIEVDPGNLVAYGRLAGLYVSQHKLDEARAEYERIARERPDAVAARTMVGLLFESENKLADAQKTYEGVIAANPQSGVAANNLAWLYAERGGNLDVALQLAQTAKQQLPAFPQVDDTLGWIYYKKDLVALAIPPLESSVQRQPSPLSELHLGLAYAKAGEVQKARTAFDAALRMKPDLVEARSARDALGPAY